MKNEWLTTKKDTEVSYIWWYDTVAILPEYDDCETGILPKGEKVRISLNTTVDGQVVLELQNHHKIKSTQLPKKRIPKNSIFCRVTPLEAIVSKEIFESNFQSSDDQNAKV